MSDDTLNNNNNILLSIINEWKIIYANEEFNNLTIEKQFIKLINIKEFFLSIYNNLNNNMSFVYLIKDLNIQNNPSRVEIMKSIEDRLLLTLNLFGENLFKSLDICLILVSDFYKFNDNQIKTYVNTIFFKFNDLLDKILNIYILYIKNNYDLNLFINTNQVDNINNYYLNLFINTNQVDNNELNNNELNNNNELDNNN